LFIRTLQGPGGDRADSSSGWRERWLELIPSGGVGIPRGRVTKGVESRESTASESMGA